MMTRGEFAEAFYTYCVLTSASQTSGIRTPRHNRSETGVAHSAHLVGLAGDVTYDTTPTPEERREWATRLGLWLKIEGTHDHLQPLEWRAG